ncbi:MAG TPA: ATPase, T2SS/T4P/T4SS family, partial [Terriglobales bacterium]|nr:ATPase, T2SS/T4P/T4SS family [Terriglobales bacterium]
DLEQAIAQQRKELRLGEELLRRNIVDKASLAATLEELTGVPYLDCFCVNPEPDALALVPQSIAEKHCALPVRISDKRLTIIMSEPQNLAALDELRFVAGMNLEPRFGFSGELKRGIARYYGIAVAESDPLSNVLSALGPEVSLDFLGAKTRRHRIDREATIELQSEHTPAVRLVSAVIAAAAAKRASDIHFEQEMDCTRVRIRVDGVLRQLTDLPAGYKTAVVSRIKILADLDISERRLPQDGSFLVRLGRDTFDLRVSTLPTQHGEKVVIRLLKASGPSAELCELGMSPELAGDFESILHHPQGMVLVAGPTGSGKSTTLYASLRMLRERQLNITTVEDPIEYVLEGITQVQVNTKAGRTFAGCLRSILRQDPNVILIGEIRDQETAEIALQAAQTGHLVLSTLHTSDSFGSISRLFDLGMSRFLVAQSASAMLAQRLVRKLCTCRRYVPASRYYPEIAAALQVPGDEHNMMWEAGGCEWCSWTGYKDRIGVYELLKFTPAVRNAVMRGSTEDELRDIARAEGLQTMFQQTLHLVREGVTSLDELLRTIPMHREQQSACRGCGIVVTPAYRYCPHCGTPQPAAAFEQDRRLEAHHRQIALISDSQS